MNINSYIIMLAFKYIFYPQVEIENILIIILMSLRLANVIETDALTKLAKKRKPSDVKVEITSQRLVYFRVLSNILKIFMKIFTILT